MTAARLEKLTVDGNDAFLVYEVDMPFGTLRTSWRVSS